MYLYFNKCRVCGQAHGVREPHKFGKAAEPAKRAGLSAEAVDTLADAFLEAGPLSPPPPMPRKRGRPPKNING